MPLLTKTRKAAKAHNRITQYIANKALCIPSAACPHSRYVLHIVYSARVVHIHITETDLSIYMHVIVTYELGWNIARCTFMFL